MCYDKAFSTKKAIEYAQRYANGPVEVTELERQIDTLNIQPHYYTSGFDHPDLMTIANDDTRHIQLMNWGLVPFWTNVIASNKTLNARSESVTETLSYKVPVQSNRCLVITDNFYEHHHKHGKTFPYIIKMINNEPFSIAGIWKENKGPSGETKRTVAILTTSANPLMSRIHNNPKNSEGPRMPVILPRELERQWLDPTEDAKHTKDLIASLCTPYDEELMEAYTVRQLKGKNGTGNRVLATEFFDYAELHGDLFGN